MLNDNIQFQCYRCWEECDQHLLPWCNKIVLNDRIFFDCSQGREVSFNFWVVPLSLLYSWKLVTSVKSFATTEKQEQSWVCEKHREKSEDHALTETTRNVFIISIKDEIYRMNTNFKKRSLMTLSCALKTSSHSKAVN